MKTIGNSAYELCQNLQSVFLNYGLTQIGESAFANTAVKSIYVPSTVKTIGTGAFAETSLKRIIIRNPNCKLEEDFVPENTIIYGYRDSSAYQYVKKHSRQNLKFIALDPEPIFTQTPSITTTSANTTTSTTTLTTIVTAKLTPEKECVMIAVNDAVSVDNAKNDILNSQDLRFFDQKTADDNGVATFSYIPNTDENWSFMFISEAIEDMVQITVGTINDLKTSSKSIAISGDANGDGEVDMSDAVLIMQAMANPNKYGINGTDPRHISENGFRHADVDGNGLTVNDAQRIQLYLLGNISILG